MRCFIPLFLVFVLGTSSVLNAQHSAHLEFLPPSQYSSISNFETDTPKLKNPNTATFIAVSGTLVSYILSSYLFTIDNVAFPATVAGVSLIMVGPSLGYLYTNDVEELQRYTLHRLAALGLASTGLLIYASGEISNVVNQRQYEPGSVIGMSMIVSGFALFYYSSVRDWFHVRKKVHEYNEQLTLDVNISPSFDPSSGTPGIALRINF